MYFSIEAFEYSFSYDDEVHYRYLNSKNQEFSESHSKIYKTSFTSSSSKTENFKFRIYCDFEILKQIILKKKRKILNSVNQMVIMLLLNFLYMMEIGH